MSFEPIINASAALVYVPFKVNSQPFVSFGAPGAPLLILTLSKLIFIFVSVPKLKILLNASVRLFKFSPSSVKLPPTTLNFPSVWLIEYVSSVTVSAFIALLAIFLFISGASFPFDAVAVSFSRSDSVVSFESTVVSRFSSALDALAVSASIFLFSSSRFSSSAVIVSAFAIIPISP